MLRSSPRNARQQASSWSRDQTIVGGHLKDSELEVVGLDASANAIKYAVEANLLDDGVAADLESGRPSPEVAAVLDDADLVISTGCIGYVGESTFKGILEVNAPRKPWMVHFVLRMFPFGEIEETLGAFGYVTEKVEDQTFLQRRFASEEEQEHVLERLSGLGIDRARPRERRLVSRRGVHLAPVGGAASALHLEDIASDCRLRARRELVHHRAHHRWRIEDRAVAEALEGHEPRRGAGLRRSPRHCGTAPRGRRSRA